MDRIQSVSLRPDQAHDTISKTSILRKTSVDDKIRDDDLVIDVNSLIINLCQMQLMITR